MKTSKPEIDRKRAASGESVEDATVVPGLQQGLSASLKPAWSPNDPREETKSPVWPEIHSFGFSQQALVTASQRSGSQWTSRMSPHINPEREIVVAYAKAGSSSTAALTMGLIKYQEFSKEPLQNLLEYSQGIDRSFVKAKRLTMRLHRIIVDRERILLENSVPFRGLVIEMGIYSRHKNNPEIKPFYIGKVKAFFPVHAAKMEVFINLDTL